MRLLGELSVAVVVVADPNVCGDEAAAGIFCAISSSSSLLSSMTMAVSLVLCGELGRSSTPPPSMVKSMASSIAVVYFYAGLYRRHVAGDMSCEQKNDMIKAKSAEGRRKEKARQKVGANAAIFTQGLILTQSDLLHQNWGTKFTII